MTVGIRCGEGGHVAALRRCVFAGSGFHPGSSSSGDHPAGMPNRALNCHDRLRAVAPSNASEIPMEYRPSRPKNLPFSDRTRNASPSGHVHSVPLARPHGSLKVFPSSSPQLTLMPSPIPV